MGWIPDWLKDLLFHGGIGRNIVPEKKEKDNKEESKDSKNKSEK